MPVLKKYIESNKSIIDKTLNIKKEDHTVENITKMNCVPAEFIMTLCLKKEYQLAAEQLAKNGYLGILSKMIQDQNVFQEKQENSWKSIILFDKNKTNINNPKHKFAQFLNI